MNSWLKTAVVVAAAFAFTLICMFVGGSATAPDVMGYVCAHLMSPGMEIAVYFFHARALGSTFFPLSVGLNVLIYSVLFGLLLELLLVVFGRRKSDG